MPSPKEAVTPSGVRVCRQEKILIPEMGKEIVCAPYDDHFIYYTNEPKQSAFMCTCGSPAVVANLGAGLMLVCLHHVYNEVHGTGGRTWQ